MASEPPPIVPDHSTISARCNTSSSADTCLASREWPYDAEPAAKPPRPFGLRAGQPKGHKWQREKAAHDAKVAKSLQDMHAKIAAYRVRPVHLQCVHCAIDITPQDCKALAALGHVFTPST